MGHGSRGFGRCSGVAEDRQNADASTIFDRSATHEPAQPPGLTATTLAGDDFAGQSSPTRGIVRVATIRPFVTVVAIVAVTSEVGGTCGFAAYGNGETVRLNADASASDGTVVRGSRLR